MIKQLALTMEWSVLKKSGEGNKSRQPQVQIPEFSPSAAGYKLDPFNLPSSIGMIEKENSSLYCSISSSSLYSISSHQNSQ